MEEKPNFLSIKIKQTFHLYEGLRDTSEDDKIFEKVCSQCMIVLVEFLDKNLSDEEKDEFFSRLNKLDQKNVSDFLAAVMKECFGSIPPEKKIILRQKMEQYIDNLLSLSINKKKNG